MSGYLAISCPGHEFEGFPVIFADLATGRYWQPSTALDMQGFVGSTGLAMDRSSIWVATTHTSGQACLIELNIMTGEVVVIDAHFSDPHSILLKDGFVFVVSTGDNSVYCYPTDGRSGPTNPVYRLDDAFDDKIHLNGICEWEGDILVGMFGQRPAGKPWSDAKSGRIKNLSSGEIIDHAMHPHTVSTHRGDLLVIESLTNTVRNISKSSLTIKLDQSLGYLRGIASWKNNFAFGISGRRGDSERTNTFSIAIATDVDGIAQHIATLPGPRGCEEIYDLLFVERLPGTKLRPFETAAVRSGPVLGPHFRWERMASLSFAADVWNETAVVHDVPLNMRDWTAKLVVLSRVPLVHLKVVLSNDVQAHVCNDSIEKWFDFYEGLSIVDIDINKFSSLRGEFDKSIVRLSMLSGFMIGESGVVDYQFVYSSGGAVECLMGYNR